MAWTPTQRRSSAAPKNNPHGMGQGMAPAMPPKGMKPMMPKHKMLARAIRGR